MDRLPSAISDVVGLTWAKSSPFVVSNQGTLDWQPVVLSRWISFPLSIHDMLSNWFSRHYINRHNVVTLLVKYVVAK